MSGLLDGAIAVVRRNFWALARCVLVVAVPVSVINVVIQGFADPHPFEYGLNTKSNEGVDTGFLVASVVTALLGWVVNVLATAAAVRAVSEGWLGAEVDWRASLRFALDRLGRLIWISILLALAIVAGVLACVLPGIWLYVAFAFALPAALFEDFSGGEALRRSFRLVQGRWWWTFLTLLVAYLLIGFVVSILTLPVGLWAANAHPPVVLAGVLTALATIVAYALATPFQAAITALLYFDLRARKEGFDLMDLAQRVGAGPAVRPVIAPIAYAPPTFLPPQPPPPPPPPPAA